MIGLERNQLFSAPHIILAPGIAHHPHRARLQPARRRPARRARPAAQPMTDDRRRPDDRRCPTTSGRRSTRPSSRSSSRRRRAARSASAASEPLLEVTRPADVVLHARRRRPGGRRHRLPRRPRRDPGPRRRVGLRQERDQPVDHAPRSPSPGGSRPARSCSTARTCSSSRRRDAQDPRQPDLDDLPAADVVAQPGHGRRRPDRRGAARSTAT